MAIKINDRENGVYAKQIYSDNGQIFSPLKI